MRVRPIGTQEELDRYVELAASIYQGNPYWVRPYAEPQQSLVTGQGPQGAHCRTQPFWVQDDAGARATVTAVVDDSFNDHWRQKAGHLLFFQARPGAQEAVAQLLSTACEWLREKGCDFARFGCLYGWQLPLTIDAYQTTPTLFHSYNPPQYHSFVKDCGFETEQGQIEYRVTFTDQLAAGYRAMKPPPGVTLRSWDLNEIDRETVLFTGVLNRNFAEHWGAPQFLPSETEGLTVAMKDFLVPEFMVFAEPSTAAARDQANGIFRNHPDGSARHDCV